MGRRIRSCSEKLPIAGEARGRIARTPESGFTLAGLLVILTILAVFIAYTVPEQWSKLMQREREKQTIFVMKQYARAIHEWQRTHNAVPVKLDQLKEARLPRVMRGPKGELLDPLTGKADWILIPPTAVTVAPGGQITRTGVGEPPPAPPPGSTPPLPAGGLPSGQLTQFNPAASPKDYSGPFIGVRPPIAGKSMLSLNGAEDYSGWYYTTVDLNFEIQLATVPNPNVHP